MRSISQANHEKPKKALSRFCLFPKKVLKVKANPKTKENIIGIIKIEGISSI